MHYLDLRSISVSWCFSHVINYHTGDSVALALVIWTTNCLFLAYGDFTYYNYWWIYSVWLQKLIVLITIVKDYRWIRNVYPIVLLLSLSRLQFLIEVERVPVSDEHAPLMNMHHWWMVHHSLVLFPLSHNAGTLSISHLVVHMCSCGLGDWTNSIDLIDKEQCLTIITHKCWVDHSVGVQNNKLY